jgi:uncharacterized protein (DUF362 family)
MSDGITRRKFVAGGVAVGASVSLGGGMLGGLTPSSRADEAEAPGLAVVTGPDGFANTKAAVDAIGGISRFVSAGSTVVINANVAFKHRGSIVAPEVLLAALELCADAGAEELWLIKGVKDEYWKRCERAANKLALLDRTKTSEREYDVLTIDRGVALKEAHVDRRLLSADVYLNIAIAKDHKGCDYTGALKNTMGACPHSPTCRFFHVGADPDPDSDDWYPDVDHLSQCIADLNTIRQPDLSILDAGEILISNGPFGPGKLETPNAVAASTDMVALDAYGVRFLGLDPTDVAMIAKSERHGLGRSDLGAAGLREVTLSS